MLVEGILHASPSCPNALLITAEYGSRPERCAIPVNDDAAVVTELDHVRIPDLEALPRRRRLNGRNRLRPPENAKR